MKHYLEARQVVEVDIAPDFTRIEIDGDGDLADAISKIDAIMADSKPYRVSRHYCGHEDKQSCNTVQIKVVS